MIHATNITITKADNDSIILLDKPINLYFNTFDELYYKENEFAIEYERKFNIGSLQAKFTYHII